MPGSLLPALARRALVHTAAPARALVPAIERRPIRTSPLNLLPGVHHYYRYLLPVMPALATAWRLPPCDLVLSMSHCVAKSARPPQGVPHICYCFTPMRYAWHMRTAYFQPSTGLKARLLERLLGALRTGIAAPPRG